MVHADIKGETDQDHVSKYRLLRAATPRSQSFPYRVLRTLPCPTTPRVQNSHLSSRRTSVRDRNSVTAASLCTLWLRLRLQVRHSVNAWCLDACNPW